MFWDTENLYGKINKFILLVFERNECAYGINAADETKPLNTVIKRKRKEEKKNTLTYIRILPKVESLCK